MNTLGKQNCIALIIAGVVFAANANADLVTNGSFEIPDIADNSFVTGPSGSGWTFFGNAGIIDAPSGYAAPEPPDGEQLGLLQHSNSAGAFSSFSQSISVPFSGLYTVTYFDAGRPGTSGFGNVPYNVLLDSTVIHTDSTTTSQPFLFNSTLPFSATAGSHVLQFQATQDIGGSSAFFDSVQMQAIPEPSSAILVLFVLIGSGVVSYCVRRKQVQQQQAAAS